MFKREVGSLPAGRQDGSRKRGVGSPKSEACLPAGRSEVGNLQPKTYNLQLTTYNLLPTTCNLQPSAFSL